MSQRWVLVVVAVFALCCNFFTLSTLWWPPIDSGNHVFLHRALQGLCKILFPSHEGNSISFVRIHLYYRFWLRKCPGACTWSCNLYIYEMGPLLVTEFHVQIHPVGVRDGLLVVTDLAGHNMTVVVMAVGIVSHHSSIPTEFSSIFLLCCNGALIHLEWIFCSFQILQIQAWGGTDLLYTLVGVEK